LTPSEVNRLTVALIFDADGDDGNLRFGCSSGKRRPPSPAAEQQPEAPPSGMVWISGGEFQMGSTVSRVERR